MGRLGFYRPQGGFFLWLDVGDGEKAASGCGARRRSARCPAATWRATDASGANPADAYIRVALVHDDATIGAALERMLRVLAA